MGGVGQSFLVVHCIERGSLTINTEFKSNDESLPMKITVLSGSNTQKK